MNPLMISAHFAAYLWFTDQPENAGKEAQDAMQFAREQWPTFVKLAHPGLGRLLLELAKPSGAHRRTRRAARIARSLAHLPKRMSLEVPFSCN